MALIWAEGMTGDKALAPQWCVLAAATARSENTSLSDQERIDAFAVKIAAQRTYQRLAEEATDGLQNTARQGQARTHVMIVGVSAYDSPDIKPVDIAVHGARAFAEWVLTGFENPDRPLGSIEFLNSPLPAQGDWKPSAASAARLGLTGNDATLPTEPALFDNIQAAFDAWMARAGTSADNAALLYFSSHGILKSQLMLCPQDGQLPGTSRGAKNLIAPVSTRYNLLNRAPNIQCYFLDACSEPEYSIAKNNEEVPARALAQAANAAFNVVSDASIFIGSCAGTMAYGPANEAPFFTQELIRCLQKRGGDSLTGYEKITTNWLRDTLDAAGRYRKEVERLPIGFSYTVVGQNTMSAQLCQAGTLEEAFVNVRCEPAAAMQGTLYVKTGPDRVNRPAARAEEWYALVPHGSGIAGVDFQGQPFADTFATFETVPPVSPVLLKPPPKPI